MAAGIRSPNLDKVLEGIVGVERALARPDGLLTVWGVATLAEIGKNFRAGGRPTWAALRPSTIAARRQGRGVGSAQPLRNTGSLQRSWDVRRLSARAIEIFTAHHAAAYHEYGTRGPYRIPKAGRRPRNRAGVLAFPVAATTFAGTTIAGGRGRRRLVGRSGARAGRPVIPAKAVGFARSVMHPGLPRRRMTPTQAQLVPALRRATIAFVRQHFPRATR